MALRPPCRRGEWLSSSGALDDSSAEEHAVLARPLDSVAVGDAQYATWLHALGDSSVFRTFDEGLEPAQGISIRAEIHGAHIGSPCAQGSQKRQAVPKGAVAEHFGENGLERPVSPVHDEQVDFLSSEVGQCFGHDPGILCFDMEHVGMTSQEAERSAYLFLTLSRAQIIDDTDSQIRSDLFRE